MCGFSIEYGSGSAKGALLKGNVEIANITAKDIVFGGILEESNSAFVFCFHIAFKNSF